MFEKIKLFFKKRKVEHINMAKPDIPIIPDPKFFYCHLCNHPFEVTIKMQFPISVPAIGKDYHFQGIGVQCPKCLKISIYG